MPYSLSAICLLQCELELIREEHTSSKESDAIEGEHLPALVGSGSDLQSGQDPDGDDRHADDYMRQLLTVLSDIL